MPKVTVVCDRCGRTIEGIEDPEGTAGFYRVTEGPWHKYARCGETKVCDGCMWEDEGYLEDHPYMRGASVSEVDHG
jgi:hypothetical protein